MNQQEYRKILAIHGYQSSDEDSDSGCKTEFDDIYEKYKPSPIDIDPSRDTIIDIEASEETNLKPNVSYSSALQDKDSHVSLSSALNMQPKLQKKISKRSRRRKKNSKRAISTEKVLEAKSSGQETVDDKSNEGRNKKSEVRTPKLEQMKQENDDTEDNKGSETITKSSAVVSSKSKPNVSCSSALQDKESHVHLSSALNMQPKVQKKRSRRRRRNSKTAISTEKVLEAKLSGQKTVDDKSNEGSSEKSEVRTSKLQQMNDTVDDKRRDTSTRSSEVINKEDNLEMGLNAKTVEDITNEKSEVMNGKSVERVQVLNDVNMNAILDVMPNIHFIVLLRRIDNMFLVLHNLLQNVCCNPILLFTRLSQFFPEVKSLGIPISLCCECTNNVSLDLLKAFRICLSYDFSPNNIQHFFCQCDYIILKNVQVWSFIPVHRPNTLDLRVHEGLCSVLKTLMRNIFMYLTEKMFNHCDLWQFENILVSKYIFGNLDDFNLGRLANDINAIRRRRELLGAPIVVQQDRKELTQTRLPNCVVPIVVQQNWREVTQTRLPYCVIPTIVQQNWRELTQSRLPHCVVQAFTDASSGDGQTSLHSHVVEVLIEPYNNNNENVSSMLQQKKQDKRWKKFCLII